MIKSFQSNVDIQLTSQKRICREYIQYVLNSCVSCTPLLFITKDSSIHSKTLACNKRLSSKCTLLAKNLIKPCYVHSKDRAWILCAYTTRLIKWFCDLYRHNVHTEARTKSLRLLYTVHSAHIAVSAWIGDLIVIVFCNGTRGSLTDMSIFSVSQLDVVHCPEELNLNEVQFSRQRLN